MSHVKHLPRASTEDEPDLESWRKDSELSRQPWEDATDMGDTRETFAESSRFTSLNGGHTISTDRSPKHSINDRNKRPASSHIHGNDAKRRATLGVCIYGNHSCSSN
jgi:hypothetical protein